MLDISNVENVAKKFGYLGDHSLANALGQEGANAYYNYEETARNLGLKGANRKDFISQMYQTDYANAFSAEQAQLTRDWQERLSNTAYSRAVSDMRNAGLNPALMFGSATASSTPSGATASSAKSSFKYQNYDLQKGLAFLKTFTTLASSAMQLGGSLVGSLTPKTIFRY